MKKLLGLLSALLISSLLLCACGTEVPELSEEENTLVAEYAASLLLKYDANYNGLYASEEEIAAADELAQKEAERKRATEEKKAILEGYKNQNGTQTSGEDENTDVSGNAAGTDQTEIPAIELAENVDFVSFLGMDGFTVSYEGYVISDTYPISPDENTFLTTQTTDGNKLVIVNFNVSNTLDQTVELDLLTKKAIFTMIINQSIEEPSLVTMQLDDLTTYSGKFKSLESKQLMIMIEVDQATADQIQKLDLQLEYNDAVGNVPLE